MNLTYTMIALIILLLVTLAEAIIIPLVGNREIRKKLFFQASCVQLLILIVIVVMILWNKL